MITKRVKCYNFEFISTCYACPEQYDVFLEGKIVGYVRLRWGMLRCNYPDVGGEEVYKHVFDEDYLGCFNSDEDRNFHLEMIAQTLYNKLNESETAR
jgi:hypothetical protein